MPAKRSSRKAPAQAAKALDPIVAPKSPAKFRARVRMYRQGLGDCFLLTFPRPKKPPFQMLIDCGVLGVGAEPMKDIVRHVRDTVKGGKKADKARLDVVVATHEHKDHLSGFNQARDIFEKEFDIGAVWMGWTENLNKRQIRKIKEAKRKVVVKLTEALKSPALALAAGPIAKDTSIGVKALLGFASDDPAAGPRTIADALEYLKGRGEEAGDLQYLDPGSDPFGLPGVPDVRVYVLGPPRDPILLKGSEVTERMKKDGVIYHLSQTGDVGVDALSAAANALGQSDGDRFHPFASEHRIPRTLDDPANPAVRPPNPYFAGIRNFVAGTYDNPKEAWRQIDQDWLGAFGQLALDLDSDTNNTSLVLAFEFVKTGEVLLFVGDAQVGNWRSWATLDFKVPGRAAPLPAHDLLARTVFYKVGHHCSHNGTLKAGGLELMDCKDLVAFIPLDEKTARNQGVKGWDMPAGPLYKAIRKRTSECAVLSDASKPIPPQAIKAGVRGTKTYIDYFLK